MLVSWTVFGTLLMFIVQSPSHGWLFANSWIAAYQDSFSFTIFQKSLRFMSIESLMPSNHLILHCPLLLLPSMFPRIRVFSNELALYIKWPNYWSFSISASNEYSSLISFKNDWFDHFAVQGTLKSLLQYHSSKISIHRCWVQHSHPYITTRKTIALTIQTFVDKVMSLLFNMQILRDFL